MSEQKFGNATASEWIIWLEDELTPPYSDAISKSEETKYVIQSFLEMARHVEKIKKGGE